MYIYPSRRAQQTPPSPIRKLVPLSIEAKRRGINVYHLNIGQPDIETPKSYLDAVRDYPYKVLEYGNSQGQLSFRQKFAEYYKANGIDVNPEQILITTGGSEAIMFAMLAVADAGDNILVFEPFYTNYNGYAVMTDIELVPVRTFPETGYHLPPRNEIEKKINSRTRAILICSPNNPTGTVLTRNELMMIAEIADKYNIFIIADEVYREFVYEGVHTSILHISELEERGIIVDSISKRFSACGARIGTIVTKNKFIMDCVIKMGQARLCPPTIEQYAAEMTLSELQPDYFIKMAEEYKQRRDVTIEELSKINGAFCKKPAGAFYIMVRLPVANIEDFAKWMLTDFSDNNETTMIAPGPGFYATPGLGFSEARIAYVLEAKLMRRAIQILAKGLREYNRLKATAQELDAVEMM